MYACRYVCTTDCWPEKNWWYIVSMVNQPTIHLNIQAQLLQILNFKGSGIGGQGGYNPHSLTSSDLWTGKIASQSVNFSTQACNTTHTN